MHPYSAFSASHNAIGSLNFAAGFFDVRTYATDYHQEIIIEENNFNNTLAPHDVCHNANSEDIGTFGGTEAGKWADIYSISKMLEDTCNQ
jgi:hypothetical protein